MRSALLFLAITLQISATAAPEIPAGPFVETFVSAFVRDRMIALRDIAGTPTAAGATWGDQNDWLDGYHCFSFTRYEWSIREQKSDRAIIDVWLYATAVTAGAQRVEVIVPRRWRLDLALQNGVWKMLGSQTRETELARDAIARKEADPWQCFLQERDVDPEVFLVKIARNNTGPGPMLEWAVREARRISSPFHRADIFGAAIGAHNAPDPARAKALAQEALSAARESGDDDALAQAHLDAGMQEWNARNDDVALEHFAASAAFVDRVRDPRASIRSSHLIGVINNGRNNHPAALAAGEATLKSATRYDWEAGMCSSRFVIANLHTTVGNLEVAAESLRGLLRCSDERGHNGTATNALLNLAAVLDQIDSRNDVTPLLRRALELAPGWVTDEVVSAIHLALGNDLLPDPKAADEYLIALELARKVDDTPGIVNALRRLSRLRYAQARFQEALEHADEALRASTHKGTVGATAGDAVQVATILMARARALRALGKTGEAEVALRQAVKDIEKQREALPAHGAILTNFLDEYAAVYRELAELLFDAKRNDEAAVAADAVKARALRDLLAAGKVDFSSRMTESDQAEGARLEREAERLNTLILQAPAGTDARAQLERQRERVRLAIEQFATAVSLRRPALRARAIAAGENPLQSTAVLQSELILHYLVTDDRTMLFVIRRGNVKSHVIPIGREELGKKVDALLAKIASRDLRSASDAKALHELLLGPVAFSPADATLCIIPDDVLWNVPFHALRGNDGRYVVERAAVHYAPSLAALATPNAAPLSGGGRVLAFGNPTIADATTRRARSLVRDVRLGNLPDAEDEVAAIGGMYGAGARVLTGPRALESTAKKEAGEYDILHFAAHAIADNRQPLYSGVVLAVTGDDGEDGILEARELMELDLRARLVVLAACSTGSGRIRAGEGLVGLSWAFLVAGCPRMVVTKWEVDSVSTKTMMIDFHRRLRAGDSAPAALRKAQLRLMKRPRFADPLYWAPFIVLGTP
ncbi:MAG TPA: CHAT domain-containing tetratricopeptide repeat protein [Thermoanaerobaculia bacterium]|nr:CHAT domain-containing tetratricopeptide repeat protein [Thermoanaerobaculia bacterium]